MITAQTLINIVLIGFAFRIGISLAMSLVIRPIQWLWAKIVNAVMDKLGYVYDYGGGYLRGQWVKKTEKRGYRSWTDK